MRLLALALLVAVNAWAGPFPSVDPLGDPSPVPNASAKQWKDCTAYVVEEPGKRAVRFGSRNVDFHYNELGRLTRVDADGQSAAVVYDADGVPTHIATSSRIVQLTPPGRVGLAERLLAEGRLPTPEKLLNSICDRVQIQRKVLTVDGEEDPWLMADVSYWQASMNWEYTLEYIAFLQLQWEIIPKCSTVITVCRDGCNTRAGILGVLCGMFTSISNMAQIEGLSLAVGAACGLAVVNGRDDCLANCLTPQVVCEL